VRPKQSRVKITDKNMEKSWITELYIVHARMFMDHIVGAAVWKLRALDVNLYNVVVNLLL